jgi:7-cyano-7-deazaguanine synthase in queuosine biosynthesis
MSAQQPRAFEVLEAGSDGGLVSGGEVVRLGEHVVVHHSRLAEFLYSPLHTEDIDLLLLAGAVTYVDRTVRRRLSSGWPRRLHLGMRVHEPERWDREEVRVALTRCVELLTGDHWSFEFHPRRSVDQCLQLPLFPDRPTEVVAMPCSGGLDSRCGIDSWCPVADQTLLAVHTKTRQSQRSRPKTEPGPALRHVAVPVALGKLDHPEATFRSRTLMFLTTAAIAARLGGGRSVLVPENGQGAIGPALVRFAGEHLHFGTHPLFTKLLSDCLAAIWDGEHHVDFVHPAVWKTKGEIVAELRRDSSSFDWRSTRSCAVDTARVKGKDAPSHCGICGGCLLRRLAFDAAGIGEFGSDVEGYLWPDLSGRELGETPSFLRDTTPNDWRLAVQGIIDMSSVADLADVGDRGHALLAGVEDLAMGLGIGLAEADSRLRRLLIAHRWEWGAALARLPDSSWVRRVATERM